MLTKIHIHIDRFPLPISLYQIFCPLQDRCGCSGTKINFKKFTIVTLDSCYVSFDTPTTPV